MSRKNEAVQSVKTVKADLDDKTTREEGPAKELPQEHLGLFSQKPIVIVVLFCLWAPLFLFLALAVVGLVLALMGRG